MLKKANEPKTIKRQRGNKKRRAEYRQTTASICSAIAPGFATFASAKPPANVIYSRDVVHHTAPAQNQPSLAEKNIEMLSQIDYII